MIFWFLSEEGRNLGVLLLEFLELYGCHFKYDTTTIRVHGSGSYITKHQMRRLMQRDQAPGLLSIEDPIQAGHDVCRSSGPGFYQVKQAFQWAYKQLHRAVLEPGPTNRGILDRILKIAPDDSEFRKWTAEQF